ncbi:MAG TPA: substrate-binding domain-containing protein, partial [Anaerolineae bacterium]|nr:substrate-binding domain-containing protein [Anaerolineae bacterium]
MKKYGWTLLTVLVVFAMLLSACGQPAQPTKAPEPTKAAEPTKAPEVKPTEAPEPEPPAGPVVATPGETVDMVLLPKFLGILVFDQAYQGAEEAHAELQNKGELQFLGPTPENSVAGQIEIVTTAATQGMDVIMLSNNAGDQITPAAQAARDAGVTVVTWDSPIPSSEGEQVFVAQVDFDETGTVMADMALNILGDDG